MNKKGSIDPAATAATIASLITWSLAPIFIKLLSKSVDSWTQNMLRYGVACLFWLPFLFYTMYKGKFLKNTWKKTLIPSFINIIGQSIWAAAFYYVNPAYMDLIVKSSVIWIACLSIMLFPQERPLVHSKRFWTGITLCMAGVCGVILFQDKPSEIKTTAIGTLMALGASVCWSFYSITLKIQCRDIDSRTCFAVVSIYTMAGLSILAFLFGKPAQCLQLEIRPWNYIIISAIFGIAISHVCYYIAIHRIGATIPSLVCLTSPFLVLLMSGFFFDEHLNFLQWIFGLTLLAGASFSIWSQQHLHNVKEFNIAYEER